MTLGPQDDSENPIKLCPRSNVTHKPSKITAPGVNDKIIKL